jgi:hypothetical protein
MRERAASAASPMAPILKAVANRKRWAEKPAAEQERRRIQTFSEDSETNQSIQYRNRNGSIPIFIFISIVMNSVYIPSAHLESSGFYGYV